MSSKAKSLKDDSKIVRTHRILIYSLKINHENLYGVFGYDKIRSIS